MNVHQANSRGFVRPAPVPVRRALPASLSRESFTRTSSTPSRLHGIAAGFAKGAALGLWVDAVTVGAPLLMGAIMFGARGALVGGLFPVAFLGLLGAANGLVDPKEMVNEGWFQWA